MSPNPDPFITHLRTKGYHPRSDKHSNALAESIAQDLFATCEEIHNLAIDGRLVYDLNFTIVAGTSEWNVDLVIGTPPAIPANSIENEGFIRQTPATVQIAVELKSIMTEHRKAVKNRKRDLEAHHEHVHNYSASAIAGGVFVINAASVFKSPLRPEQTEHKNPLALVDHCLGELRAVSVKGGSAGYGLEAKCALVVDMDNMSSSAKYVTGRPAPQIGDPQHYDTFIQTICQRYKERF